MNKFAKICLGVVGVAFAVTSCTSPKDDNPKIDVPTEFVLNTPPMAKQYIELENSSTIDFTCSQPNYGAALAATYVPEVGVKKEGADTISWQAIDQQFNDCSALNVDAGLIAQALCKIYGIKKAEYYDDLMPEGSFPVYVRFKSTLDVAGKDSSMAKYDIYSNAVTLENVLPYCNVEEPGFIYLIGKPSGWKIDGDDLSNWRLYENEDAIGSKIYTGTFNINSGDFQFRFYTAIGSWDSNSYGAQVDDNPVDITFADGVYSGNCIAGKGSYQVNDWAGGEVTMTVNLNSNIVEFKTASSPTPTEKEKITLYYTMDGVQQNPIVVEETTAGSGVFQASEIFGNEGERIEFYFISSDGTTYGPANGDLEIEDYDDSYTVAGNSTYHWVIDVPEADTYTFCFNKNSSGGYITITPNE